MLRSALSKTNSQSAVILIPIYRNEESKNNMKPIGTHNYFVYIVTNYNKTVLYVGVTKNLRIRISEHEEESKKIGRKHFTGKYKTIYLIYMRDLNILNMQSKEKKKSKAGQERRKKYS